MCLFVPSISFNMNFLYEEFHSRFVLYCSLECYSRVWQGFLPWQTKLGLFSFCFELTGVLFWYNELNKKESLTPLLLSGFRCFLFVNYKKYLSSFHVFEFTQSRGAFEWMVPSPLWCEFGQLKNTLSFSFILFMLFSFTSSFPWKALLFIFNITYLAFIKLYECFIGHMHTLIKSLM